MPIKVVDKKWVNDHVYMTHVVFPGQQTARVTVPESEVQNFYDYKNLVTNCINHTKGITYPTKEIKVVEGQLMAMRKTNFMERKHGAPEEMLKPLGDAAQSAYHVYLNKVMLNEDAETEAGLHSSH